MALFAVAIALLGSAIAYADDTKQAQDTFPAEVTTVGGAVTPQEISKRDQDFVNEAAQAELAIVEEAQLVLGRSRRSEIKDFAEWSSNHHQKSQNQLRSIAIAEGVIIPVTPAYADEQDIAAMRDESGALFDHAYITGERDRFRHLMVLYEQESKRGKSESLRAFSAAELPYIRYQFLTAQTIAALPTPGAETTAAR
ncbi:MAG TPA: DUF4142 domain-containing protein [Magnetospirillaceae bacterium]